jgi:hypothetical protein
MEKDNGFLLEFVPVKIGVGVGMTSLKKLYGFETAK